MCQKHVVVTYKVGKWVFDIFVAFWTLERLNLGPLTPCSGSSAPGFSNRSRPGARTRRTGADPAQTRRRPGPRAHCVRTVTALRHIFLHFESQIYIPIRFPFKMIGKHHKMPHFVGDFMISPALRVHRVFALRAHRDPYTPGDIFFV